MTAPLRSGPPPRSPSRDAAAATRGGMSLLALQSLGRALGLVFVMVLSRHLTSAGVGRYSAVAALVLVANLLADFGTSPAITRLVSRDRDEADVLLSRTILPSLAFGLAVAVGVIGFGLLAYRGPQVVDLVIGSLAVPAASVLSSVLGALDGAGLISRRALVTALQTLVIAGGVVPVLAGAGVRAAIIALAVAPWLALVVAVTMARHAGLLRSRLQLDLTQTRRLLRTALPFALSGGMTAFTLRFDVILLSVARSASETAHYDLALRLLEAMTYLGTAIGGPLLFILSGRLGRGDHEGAARAYREAIRLLYALGLPLSAALVILARPLVAAALGAGFAPVATPLAILAAGQWLTFVILAQGTLVMGGNVVGRGIVIGVANAAVTVGLDVVLVPRFGPVGAALAMVASWIFAALALDRFHRRTVGIATPLPCFSVVASTAAMAVMLLATRGAPLLVTGVAGAITYGSAIMLTGGVRSDDLSRLRHAMSAPPS